MSQIVFGSCLCGAVRYRVSGPVRQMGHCHCSMCRKAHGTAFGTYAIVAREDFAILSGADAIRRYESSPGTTRTFCGRCGSTLQFILAADTAQVELAAGTLDDDPGTRPGYHIWVGSKAPWHEIVDSLPQHEREREKG